MHVVGASPVMSLEKKRKQKEPLRHEISFLEAERETVWNRV